MKPLQPKSYGRVAVYIILLVATVAAMAGLRHYKIASGRNGAPGGDTLAVALQYSPVAFFMDGDTLAGLDYDLLKMLGIPFRIYPITSPAEGLQGLDEGRYDMVIADLPQSADLSDRYLFTVPAYLDRQVLVQKTDSVGAKPAVTSVLELIGDTVCTTAGSPMVGRIANISREIGGEIYVTELPVTSEKLLLTQTIGEIDHAVVNEQVARSVLADNYPEFDYSMQISFSQFQPWALRLSDTAKAAAVNSRLDSIKATEGYSRLLSRYLR